MPVPKRKRSRPRRDKRFANKHISVIEAALCPTCKEPRTSHQVCKACGHYKGVKIMQTSADRMLKRTASRKSKEARKATYAPPSQSSSSESSE